MQYHTPPLFPKHDLKVKVTALELLYLSFISNSYITLFISNPAYDCSFHVKYGDDFQKIRHHHSTPLLPHPPPVETPESQNSTSRKLCLTTGLIKLCCRHNLKMITNRFLNNYIHDTNLYLIICGRKKIDLFLAVLY